MAEVASQVVSLEHDLLNRDGTDDGTRFEQTDPFVHKGKRDEAQALRERDVGEDLCPAHSDRLGGINLSLPNGLKPCPKELRLVGNRVQREREIAREEIHPVEPGPGENGYVK